MITEIMLCIGCLTMVCAYLVRENEHKEELEQYYQKGYEKGYGKGLYENVIKMSSED